MWLGLVSFAALGIACWAWFCSVLGLALGGFVHGVWCIFVFHILLFILLGPRKSFNQLRFPMLPVLR